jgi:hypothetical protein
MVERMIARRTAATSKPTPVPAPQRVRAPVPLDGHRGACILASFPVEPSLRVRDAPRK